jgi:hypothetical protein
MSNVLTELAGYYVRKGPRRQARLRPIPGAGGARADRSALLALCRASGWGVREGCTDGVRHVACPVCGDVVTAAPSRAWGPVVRFLGAHSRAGVAAR